MIKASFCFEPMTDAITQVSLSGHAGFDTYGNDIVCASVSALLIATINGLEEYVGINTKVNIKEGDTIFFIDTQSGTQTTQAQAIVHTFYLAMLGLQDEYEDFIEVNLM